MENDLIHRNVFAKVTVPKTEAEEREPIDEATRKLIFDTCEGHRMGIPALVMLYTGIRKGELLALKWEDVDLVGERLTVNKAVAFPDNSVSIKTPKTKAGTRTVTIPKKIIPRCAGLFCRFISSCHFWLLLINDGCGNIVKRRSKEH